MKGKNKHIIKAKDRVCTVPYMGSPETFYVMFSYLRHNFIMPPKPTKRTLELGVKYSPEFICIPFKFILGTYLEAIELGVNTIITAGHQGPCRAGLYGIMHQMIMRDMGHKVDVIYLDPPSQGRLSLMKAVYKAYNLGKNSPFRVWHAGKLFFTLYYVMDKMEKHISKIRAYEIRKGKISELWKNAKEEFSKITTLEEMYDIEEKYYKLINEIPLKKVDESEKIRIGVIGEIYVVMEQASNFNLEERLNYLGVEVERTQYQSEWSAYNLKKLPWAQNPAAKQRIENALDQAEEHFPTYIGGHSKDNIGFIKILKNEKFDGIVHLYPFGCLPELCSISLIPELSHKYDIPIISLAIDEQTAEAHIQTRLEAFIDLIKSKRKYREKTFSV